MNPEVIVLDADELAGFDSLAMCGATPRIDDGEQPAEETPATDAQNV